MDKIKKAAKLIQTNWRALAGFELLYKILSMAVFILIIIMITVY